jgi:hypothetical protein
MDGRAFGMYIYTYIYIPIGIGSIYEQGWLPLLWSFYT